MKPIEIYTLVAEAYMKGVPIDEIQHKFKITYPTMYKILDIYKLPRRKTTIRNKQERGNE